AFRFHSIVGEFERAIRIGLVTRLLSRWMISPPVPASAGPCDWVAGASMIIRREVFERVGLMDEKYFMYFEEVDFCLAANRAVWRLRRFVQRKQDTDPPRLLLDSLAHSVFLRGWAV